MIDLEAAIEKRIGEVRSDTLDISFGEIISLKSEKEFDLNPEYQRLFRWSEAQRSRLVESILLELPIPQIFIVERPNGVYELVDGLQRISSVIQFIQPSLIDLEPLTLSGCDLVKDLNGKRFEDLPLSLRLRLKRSAVRAIVIKRSSTQILRYEMFKRLNTGGADLSPQEIRNCTARMIGENGIKFYNFLVQCASQDVFQNCVSTLPDREKEQKGDEELVLRYLALKNMRSEFKGSVKDWLDKFMEDSILGNLPFDYDQEQGDFTRLFEYINNLLGDGAFVRYRDNQPKGGLAPAYFEAVTLGVWNKLATIQSFPIQQVKEKLIFTLQTDEFRQYVGSGSNASKKFDGRISEIERSLGELATNGSF